MQVDNERSLQAIERLEALYEVLKKYGTEKYVSFDLGLLNQYNYYTGVIFKGYTYGVGDAIVTGGRYDKLLSYFGKNAPAIGFVVVVDDVLEALSRQNKKPHTGLDGCLLFYTPDSYDAALKKANELRLSGVSAELIPVACESGLQAGRFERKTAQRGDAHSCRRKLRAVEIIECTMLEHQIGDMKMAEDRYLTFALTKGRLADKTLSLLEQVGITCEEMKDKNSRKLVFVNEELKLKFFLAKGPDVPTYVEYGAADIGVTGKDILPEEGRRVYEVLDLGFGKCRMCVCGPESARGAFAAS